MKLIETVIKVASDHTATLRVPEDVSPGEHRAVVVVDQNGNSSDARKPLNLPAHDVGAWPANRTLRREDLYDDDGR
jgi:hypothetical protein